MALLGLNYPKTRNLTQNPDTHIVIIIRHLGSTWPFLTEVFFMSHSCRFCEKV